MTNHNFAKISRQLPIGILSLFTVDPKGTQFFSVRSLFRPTPSWLWKKNDSQLVHSIASSRHGVVCS